jgi:hypothetical protein
VSPGSGTRRARGSVPVRSAMRQHRPQSQEYAVPESVSTATATIRLPMSASAGSTGDWAAAGAIRVLPDPEASCCGGACCRD